MFRCTGFSRVKTLAFYWCRALLGGAALGVPTWLGSGGG
jgi:hypothetical protein